MSAVAPVPDAKSVYNIVSRVHVSRWSNELQAGQDGWDIRAYWIATGTYLPVFVPDTQYTAENVDALIRHAGAIDERVHGLGN